MEQVVEHWWNGAWGRIARYDVWLKHLGGTDMWRVEAQRGGGDGRWWASVDLTEERARAVAERIRRKRSGDWQQMRS